MLSCAELRDLLKSAGKKYPHLALIENYFECDTTSLKGLVSSMRTILATGAVCIFLFYFLLGCVYCMFPVWGCVYCMFIEREVFFGCVCCAVCTCVYVHVFVYDMV